MRRLVVVGGLVALAAFAIWWFAEGGRLAAKQATDTGLLDWHDGTTLFVMTGCDTTDLYFVRRPLPGQYEVRALDMEWRDANPR